MNSDYKFEFQLLKDRGYSDESAFRSCYPARSHIRSTFPIALKAEETIEGNKND